MTLKKRLLAGDKVVGTFIHIYSPAIVEMIGYAGFDFIVIDNEHGGFSDKELEHLIRAAELAQVFPIVRISSNDDSIQKALDRGARGLQIPMMNTACDAETVVKKATFPPTGQRGATYSIRPAKYGRLGGRDYLNQVNDDLLIIAQIEAQEGVNNFDEILSVPGIDVAFIGPLDLALSTGYEGPKDPANVKQVKELAERANKIGKPAGTIAPTKEAIQDVIISGFSYVVGVTNAMFYESLDGYIGEWNGRKET